MGACASVPKGLKAEAGGAPLPEQPKEETTTTEAPEVAEVIKAEDGEKKVDGTSAVDNVDDKPKNEEVIVATEKETVNDDSEKSHSLDALINDQGEPKEELTGVVTGAEAVPSTTVKAEEKAETAATAPVFDSPTKKEEEAEKPSTDNIAEVKKEENTTQQKS